MKDRRINTNKLMINKLWYLFVFFLFVIISIFLFYRCLANYKVGNITISEFIENRNVSEEVIMPSRGNIYDAKGNVLAQDVSSYTLIAFLSETRSTEKVKRHVIDKEKTAKALSKKIDMSYEKILAILNKDAYQVEFGLAGKNLTQSKMEEIAALELPGIGFSKTTKRYYPMGNFASYLLGYTTNKEDENGNIWMTGEMGIEGYYNDELKGKSGYIKYEKDAKGNKIANSNEYQEDAVNGDNITLTIDSNIQLFVQNAVNKAAKESKGEWVVMGVMNAKTGAILGYASSPSFDPNIRNITSYMDPLVSYSFEPGSTMKTFTYMCAINSGRYNGSDTYMSGSKTYTSAKNKNDKVTIKDWNVKGWGRISYDFGYVMSSNIGIANLLEHVITKNELRSCLQNYGFGKPTGITLNGELKGDISFTYDVEAATAGYGQGITITPIQMLQALSSVANDGVIIKPYVVSNIKDSNGNIVLENHREEVNKVASTETINKVKELMRNVVCNNGKVCTGYAYYMKGYDILGKTGTAYIFDNKKGRYMTGISDNIYSFSGLYPGDDPEIVIYMAIKRPKDTYNYIAPVVKSVIKDVSKYLALDNRKSVISNYYVGDFSNRTISSVKDELSKNNIKTILLGTGSKVVGQYPMNVNMYDGDKVYILTNNYKNETINFNGLSYKEAKSILDLMNVKYELVGTGFVYEQSIGEHDIIKDKIILKLKDKYVT